MVQSLTSAKSKFLSLAETLIATIRNAIKRGDVYRVSERRVALPEQLSSFAHQLIRMDSCNEEISVVAVKQQWETGRNLTVELLEYFDNIRFTQRQGQIRKILDPQLPEKTFQQ